ncbi:hypothetical protein EPN42_15060 [bacterium]|nr:MAG: hypothetical protein EPN42_15060 [bacterium]
MSARTNHAPPTGARPLFQGLLYAAGPAPLAGVAGAGLTFGFFAWYAAVSHLHALLAVTDLVLLTLIPLGTVAAVAAWQWYANYVSWRTGISHRTALILDAWSFLPLYLLWLPLALLPFRSVSEGPVVIATVALWGAVKLAAAVRLSQTIREVTVTYLVTRIPLIIIALLGATLIGQRAGTHWAASHDLLLTVWGRWDAQHYIEIAANGYHGTNMAFFPLYPLLLAILGKLTGSHLIAGLIVSNAALYVGLLFFYKLVEHELRDRRMAHRAIFYISIFPTAIFFSAVYTESLFFALTVASFYYIRERKWLLAGIVGAFASATRVEGVLLFVPFAIEWWAAHRNGEPISWRSVLGIGLVPAGMLAYMGYLWVLVGDPLYFSHVQAHWNRHFAPPWVSIGNSIHLLTHAHLPQSIAYQSIELVFTALMIVMLALGFRTLRTSYWAYMLLSVIVPLSTSSLMSMPRFALVLFPIFIVLAIWGRRPAVNNAVVAFSLPLLGLFTVLFADWYWIA